jgi:adenine deaminase
MVNPLDSNTNDTSTTQSSSQTLAAVARREQPAETVIKNASIINVHTGELRHNRSLLISNGRIAAVTETGVGEAAEQSTIIDAKDEILAPGFLDTHVHYESSMVTATGFCRGVVPTGTTGAFMDPHEIGNVLGLKGIRQLLDEAANLPLKTFCTIPSCVPAAPGFEDAGAEIDTADIERALGWDDVIALGEMMNYPGVIDGDDEVHTKLAATHAASQRATGHFASRETDANLDAYVASGISSCHESVRKQEALAKLRRGMWTMLRQGSAWKDIPETIRSITETDVDTRHLLLVSDDTHPDTITEKGHLDRVLRVAIANGLDPITAVQAVTINAAEYYGVDEDLGALSPGKIADIVFLDELSSIDVSRVMIDGSIVVEDGTWTNTDALPSKEEHTDAVHEAFPPAARDTVKLDKPTQEVFTIDAPEGAKRVEVAAIQVEENQVPTKQISAELDVHNGTVDIKPGISKAAVLERHGGDGSVGRGFISGFGFDRGAVASTVAHDSHNLLVVGKNDIDMTHAATRVMKLDGGMVAVNNGDVLAEVPLPIAGVMSDQPLSTVTEQVQQLESAWAELGCSLESPFMTMSLLALAVIPELRLTNRGLVDTVEFDIIDPIRQHW